MALAANCITRGHFKSAEKHYEKVIRLSRDSNTEAFFQLGHVFAGQQQFDAAIACFERCIQLEPDSTPHYLSLGMCHVALGKSYEALRVCTSDVSLTFL